MGRLKFHESSQRERTVAFVLARAALNYSPGPVLVIDDLDGHAEDDLRASGFDVTRWTRWKVGDRAARVWPEAIDGGYELVVMRLPRIKDAFEMALHAAASVMADDGLLLVGGANDEGIKSADALMRTVFQETSTVDTRRHCRVISGAGILRDDLRPSLKQWRRDLDERTWYPGVFAQGAVDHATKLLLDNLPPLTGSVLDFACGAGVIAARLVETASSVAMSDADAIALAAASDNVGDAQAILSDGLRDIPGRFDAIVSNPPIHRGAVEDFTVLRGLIEGAPAKLTPGGQLLLVVQRQVPLKDWPGAYTTVDEIAGDTRFKVIRAQSGRAVHHDFGANPTSQENS